MPDHAREDHAIEVFCNRMSVITACALRDTGQRPDQQSPGQPNPDALLQVGREEWSVEHRTLDSFRGMRADTAVFMDLTRDLAGPVAAVFPDVMLWLSFGVHSWPSLPTRARDGFRTELRDDVIEAVGTLPARIRHGRHQFDVTLTRTKMELTIHRHRGRGIPLIFRSAPADQSGQLQDEVARALREKNDKLSRHAVTRPVSLLLLDSDDLSTINQESVHAAFGATLSQLTPAFDHIFFARTRPDPPFVYPFWVARQPSSLEDVREYGRAQASMEWGDAPFGAPVLAPEVLLRLQLQP